MPKVSVLMPVYKTDEKYLREAISSILNQTFTDFEFLILDDCPDDTREGIVRSYNDDRIKYSKNEQNLGITPSRNKLIDIAKGEYLAVFDHDDISLPTRFEKEVKYLNENPDVGVVSAQYLTFDERNTEKASQHPEFDIDIKCALTSDCYIAHPVAMIRKSVLDENNIRYERFFSPCEDYQLWNRLISVTHFYNIQEILLRYRSHLNNTSHLQNKLMCLKRDAVCLDIQNRFPAYHAKWLAQISKTRFRLRLFGFIPLLKVKRDRVYLFEIFPIFTIKGSKND